MTEQYKNKIKRVNSNLSEIILNVNGLNTSIKRQRLAECIKNVLTVYCL